MSTLFRFLFITMFIVFLGGAGYIAFADVNPPVNDVEKIIPNTQFFTEK